MFSIGEQHYRSGTALRQSLALVTSLLSGASAFTFAVNNTDPHMCTDVLVTWQGGNPPFKLLIIPAFNNPSNILLDSSTWDNSSATGEYVWSANYDAGTRYIAVMSDAQGLATGGVSSIMTIAIGGDDNACTLRNNVSDVSDRIFPQSELAPQCSTRRVKKDQNTTWPMQVVGAIPQGNAFVLPDDIFWTINIASGTQFILTMLDPASSGNGTSSDFIWVSDSLDTSCLDAASPKRTPGSTWGTPEGKAATTLQRFSHTARATSGSSSLSPLLSSGAIIGIVIGSLIVLVALQIVIFWFCRTRVRHALAKTPIDLSSQWNESDLVWEPLTHNDVHNAFNHSWHEIQASSYDVHPDVTHVVAGEASDRGWHDGSLPGLRRSNEGDELDDPFRDGTETTENDSQRQIPSSSTFLSSRRSSSESMYSMLRHTKNMLGIQGQARAERRPELNYVRHRDAGQMEEENDWHEESAGEVIDLPPLYDDAQRRH